VVAGASCLWGNGLKLARLRARPNASVFGNCRCAFRNIHLLNRRDEHVLVLSADHIYDMDYRELLQYHVHSGADATVAAILYPIELSRQFGILEVDHDIG